MCGCIYANPTDQSSYVPLDAPTVITETYDPPAPAALFGANGNTSGVFTTNAADANFSSQYLEIG